jgi:uncharacterized protein (TIGR02453 family)
MNSFCGFPPESLAFFAGLEADNSKTYWQSNKTTWEDKVHGPMVAFVDAFAEVFQPFRLFRPNRDVRFSKDKSPYKTQTGAVSEPKGGSMYYVHLSASGLFAATGLYITSSDQLERFRRAVDHDGYGTQLEQIIHMLTTEAQLHVSFGGEAPLKTTPRGYAKDHPRLELLRWKGLSTSKEFGTPAWLHTAEAVKKVEAFWYAAAPLNDWLTTYVGPSQQTPTTAERRTH